MKELINLLQNSQDRGQIEAIVRRIVCETWIDCQENERIKIYGKTPITLEEYLKKIGI